MRTVFLSINVITALVLVAGDSPCQDTRVYRHPSLNIQFEAPPDWDRVARPEDELIYEVADPDGAVHVVLWYTTTEQGPQDYLRKMAQMKDLAVGERPSPAQIGDRDAWTLSGPGREGDAPVRMILAAIPDGKSAARPKENVLFIVTIWCPEADYEDHRQRMEDILDSVEIVETP
jgi:hypothetical protein